MTLLKRVIDLRKFLLILACALMVTATLPMSVSADTGPKPSVVIDFAGLENEVYYATLLSEGRSTGPESAYDAERDNARYSPSDTDYAIWEKFVSYKDADGFYFLQFFDECTETAQFKWGYYPPEKFKILLYFPEKDSFAVSSEIFERYAFDSYYTVRLSGDGIQVSANVGGGMVVVKSYNYGREIFSLIVRIILTIAIEVLVALAFGFRSRKQLRLIQYANIGTQVLLNVALNYVNYKAGGMLYVFAYVFLELVVFAFEAAFYAFGLSKYGEGKTARKGYNVLYAAVANAASFGVGLALSYIIPMAF